MSPALANTLTRRMHEGINTTCDEGQTLIPMHGGGFDVAHSLRGEGFDASEDGTGRGTPLVPVAFDCKGSQVQVSPDGQTPTLRSMSSAQGHENSGGQLAVAFAIQERAVSENLNQGPQGKGYQADIAYTLEARNKVQATAFDLRGREHGAQFEGPHDTANIRASSGGSSRSYVASTAVRRLTPRECERLQGFPEVQKCYTILVCRDLSDQQKTNVLAALECRKLPSNVWPADASGWSLCAEAAAHHFNTDPADRAPPVALDVLIDLERQEVRLHSAGRSFSIAASAGERNGFPLPLGVENFARFVALLTHAWGLATSNGKAELLASMRGSTHRLSGRSIAISFGPETGEHASDAANAIGTATRLFTSTTLPHGLETETLLSTLQTLCCCVAHAIAGFIPAKTKAANCYVVRLTTTQGFTAVPNRGKPAADGPRYKALGNSMAVPVMAWIGERIQQVECLPRKTAA